ncbi:OmpA protein [Bacteroides graminisolvens DSM 19988 = JCM 15093]|uniref:OmpA protein n=1 Tax=Bacteroides graminisolvens DSM 19988 = JCM 15093 TaxID=1121097 RepID=A0A069D3A3_9BACE|nr:OmpA protein [Bacteroides graminisolvens DSM 19988 = JCM 15093]
MPLSLGLGLQGEYLMPLQKDLPRFVQVSARVMWRIGGKSKRTASVMPNRIAKRRLMS